MKRDAWTSNFRDILFALDFPQLVDKTPVVPEPDRLPGAVVHIPDTNLRAAIAEALGKSPNAPITVAEMQRLRRFEAQDRGIQDLTGLQFATNLRDLTLGRWAGTSNQISDLSPIAGLINLHYLFLVNNQVSDLSPIAGLINLHELLVSDNPISDISPLRGLTNLTLLHLAGTLVSDISLVRNLANLTHLEFHNTLVTDVSPVAGLINLEGLAFSNENLSDLSPLAGLVNLKWIFSWGNSISDLSPLTGLTKLERVDICGGDISNLSPLAPLTGLKELYLAGHKISDISPLSGLTNLTRLGLEHNDISDISALSGLTNLTWSNLAHNNILDVSPLAGLTNLKWLGVDNNDITDISPLDGLRENTKLIWYHNPAFPKGGPKIEGPWLWVVLPYVRRDFDSGADLLSEASGGVVTEVEVSTHGATEGKLVGNSVWVSHRLPPTGRDNIEDMLKRFIPEAVIYGTVSLYSPQEQETTMYVGSDFGAKVWLNGTSIYKDLRGEDGDDYHDFVPATLKQGVNVLLVAVQLYNNANSAFFGFEPGTEYTVANPSVGYAFSKSPIHTGDTFTLDIGAKDVFDLAGWQFDIAFDPAALEAINVSEGDFLKTDGGTTFFQSGGIDNASGKITGLSAARLSTQGVNGTGPLLHVRFKSKIRR